MKKHIPNTITCCNLICGCIATYFALQPAARYDVALAFIIGGAVFDFFDGFLARLLHVSSPIGKELDSLADDITFGFAPAAMVFSLLRETMPQAAASPVLSAIPFLAFLIAAFSALRLAKFNLDERQATSFIGLPTPANALFWGALITGYHDTLTALPAATWWLSGGVLCSSLLLVSEIPMFALKFKHFGWKGNALRYSFVLCSLVLLALQGPKGFASVIVLYILVSVIAAFVQKSSRQ